MKFFELYQILYLVKKQVYKVKLSKNWKTHNIFYIYLLENDIIKKNWADENIIKLDFKSGNNKEYKVEIIENNMVYARKLKTNHL